MGFACLCSTFVTFIFIQLFWSNTLILIPVYFIYFQFREINFWRFFPTFFRAEFFLSEPAPFFECFLSLVPFHDKLATLEFSFQKQPEEKLVYYNERFFITSRVSFANERSAVFISSNTRTVRVCGLASLLEGSKA